MLIDMISQTTIKAIREFVHERDWEQFHTPENLAKSISIEAAELLECFQWSESPRNADVEHVKAELADVLTYCIIMADALNADMDEIVMCKLSETKRKYPAATVKGSSRKYRKLQ